jgi:hypothetical protein
MHLSSARILAATEDAGAAFVTAYDAARKSLAAMLAVQGLRARGGDGGHRVLSELMQAQLPQHKGTVREFDWMRQKRNDTQYPAPGKPTATANDLAAVPVLDAATVTTVIAWPPHSFSCHRARSDTTWTRRTRS